MIDLVGKFACEWENLQWHGTREPEYTLEKFNQIDSLKDKIEDELLDVIFGH